MNTITVINERGSEIIQKLKAGQILTKEENDILKIYNSLNAGSAFNAGKRKVKKSDK